MAHDHDDHAAVLGDAGYKEVQFQGKGVVCTPYDSGAKIKAFPVNP